MYCQKALVVFSASASSVMFDPQDTAACFPIVLYYYFISFHFVPPAANTTQIRAKGPQHLTY
jgi:hypothetical protein